jgi:hypothetical protein
MLKPHRFYALLLSASYPGCAEPPADARAVSALHTELAGAIASRDAGALYDKACPELHAELDALVAQLATAAERVESFPAREARALWRSAGIELLDHGHDGRGVFIAIATFPELRWTQQVAEGLAVAQVDLAADSATVKTVGGESFAYRRTPSGWCAQFPLDAWMSWPARENLAKNFQSLERNTQVLHSRVSRARDPATVEGAHNRLRIAVAARDAEVAYSLVDAETRRRLDAICGKALEPSAVGAALGLNLDAAAQAASSAANATDGRALLGQWMAQGSLATLLPSGDNDAVAEVSHAGRGRSVVRCAGGQEWDWIREEDDVWRSVSLKAALAALTSRVSKSP